MRANASRLIVIIGVFGISMSAIFSRLIEAPSLTAAMYRMLFTAILMLPVVLFKHLDELAHAGLKNLLFCAASGVFLGFHFACYFESLKYTSIAASTVLVNTEVLVVALAVVCIFRERIPRAGIAGIALAFIGSTVVAAGDAGGGSNILYGDLMAIGGALCSSMYTLIGRNERKDLSTSLYTFLVYTFAAVTLIITVLLTGTEVGGLSMRDYLAIMGMVIFCTLMGHSVFSWALGKVSAAYVSVAKLGEPVFATILGFILFSEKPGINQVAGGIIILTGILMYLFTKDTGKE